MYINNYTGNKIIKFTFYSLLYFLVFDYILAFTIFKSQTMIFFMMILNLLSFIFCFFIYGFVENRYARMWTLYLVVHILGLVVNNNISTVPYWIISLLILYMPRTMVGVFNPKIFVYIGLFFAGGVFFQYLFPFLYSSYVLPLFIGSAFEFIESSSSNEFGFSGFSPQSGTTAYVLLICQAILLAFKDDKSFLKTKWLKYGILIIFIFAILLTGKRMSSLISIALLLAAIYISGFGSSVRNTLLLLFLFFGCYIVFQYFVENVGQYSDNVILKRFASSYNSASEGSDITSGRGDLYKKAWYYFEQEPILGIGANNFSKIGGMETSVHNTYLQVLCEEGVLRFMLFISPIVLIFLKTIKQVFKRAVRPRNPYLLLSLFLQLVFILYSFTGNTIVNNNNFVLYFLGVSFFAYASQSQNQSY